MQTQNADKSVAMNAISPPQKTREIHNNHMDSTRWNDFKFRDDDIVIGTYAKSGTTWMQQIIGQLVFNGAEGVKVAEISPWLDLRLMPRAETNAMLEAQTHRRFIKTHLPLDAFVFNPRVKHIYVARDGRDAIFSMHHHHRNFTPEIMAAFNETPGLVGPRLDPACEDQRQYFIEWLEDRGFPIWSFWESVRSWWGVRELANVKLVHFSDLKRDPEGEIRVLADYLEMDIAEGDWPRILDHCSFDYMKAHANDVAPLSGAAFIGGGETFINKGSNGRWRDMLTEEDSARYEARALAELGPDCAAWLKGGKQGLRQA